MYQTSGKKRRERRQGCIRQVGRRGEKECRSVTDKRDEYQKKRVGEKVYRNWGASEQGKGRETSLRERL